MLVFGELGMAEVAACGNLEIISHTSTELKGLTLRLKGSSIEDHSAVTNSNDSILAEKFEIYIRPFYRIRVVAGEARILAFTMFILIGSTKEHFYQSTS